MFGIWKEHRHGGGEVVDCSQANTPMDDAPSRNGTIQCLREPMHANIFMCNNRFVHSSLTHGTQCHHDSTRRSCSVFMAPDTRSRTTGHCSHCSLQLKKKTHSCKNVRPGSIWFIFTFHISDLNRLPFSLFTAKPVANSNSHYNSVPPLLGSPRTPPLSPTPSTGGSFPL